MCLKRLVLKRCCIDFHRLSKCSDSFFITLERKHHDTTNYCNPQTNRGRAHRRNVRLPHALLAIRFCLILIGGCSTLRWLSILMVSWLEAIVPTDWPTWTGLRSCLGILTRLRVQTCWDARLLIYLWGKCL